MRDREAWRAAVHGVTKSQTRQSKWTARLQLGGWVLHGWGPSPWLRDGQPIPRLRTWPNEVHTHTLNQQLLYAIMFFKARIPGSEELGLLLGLALLAITIVTYFRNWNFSIPARLEVLVPGWTDYFHQVKYSDPDAIITIWSFGLLTPVDR